MPTCVALCCVAMISTLHSVWLRPAVLGGFGGMSDRFTCFMLSSVRLVACAARRWEKVGVVKEGFLGCFFVLEEVMAGTWVFR